MSAAAPSFTHFNGYQGVPPTNGVFPLADKSVTYEPEQVHALFLDTIVGRHGGLHAVLSQVEIVAPTNATVYRNAASVADLVVLHSTVQSFKPGSEKARRVTTVAGATSISVHCQFTNVEGQPLLERDVTGKVRFFGGNLRATYDFAKKASGVAHENFSLTDSK